MLRGLLIFLFSSVALTNSLYAQSSNDVQVERWDEINSDITGILRNNTENGIYDIELAFTFRDLEGRVLSSFRVSTIVGTPATIEGEFYFSTHQTLDYIPPKSL